MQKKKLIAVLLLVAMLFTLVPTAAMAGTEAATVSITASVGADVQLFTQTKNYVTQEIQKTASTENQDGTITYYFETTADKLTYRVSKEQYITKAGSINSGAELTVVYTDNDLYSNAVPNVETYKEANVLLNINKQNQLRLQQDETFRLRAYRSWQIVGNTISNIIIEPDFHYKVLSGDDVINITPVVSGNGNAKGNWLDITAKQAGTAIVEVTYDAIDIAGQGVYGACDAGRTGLVVVQVGDVADDVDFGVDCFSSNARVYDKDHAQPWDAEFDTLYFTGDTGKLQLNPTVTTGSQVTVSKVEVSHDRGNTWKSAIATDDGYEAEIGQGNNIIRITKSDSTTPSAYQLVRGEKVDVKLYNRTNPEQAFAVGDKVCVTIDGLHIPVGKMAGIYNPCYDSDGWGNSDWATSAAKISYSNNGERISSSQGSQYELITKANYIEFTLSDNEVNLTDGYVSADLWGSELNDEKNHRGLDDDGTGVNFSAATVHYTRSILPDITVSVGQNPSGNRAPELKNPNITSADATITLGNAYHLFVNQLFTDADNDALTYSVSVNDAAEQTTNADYQFKPDKAGTYTLVFKANDGQADSPVYTVTLTVKQSSSAGGGGDADNDSNFDMDGQPIAGYITMSVEDRAKRPANSNVPVALGTIIAPVEVPYADGETVAQVTMRLFNAYNIGVDFGGTVTDGFYLKSIKTDWGSLGEFDAGGGSGWMFTCDGEFPEVSVADIKAAGVDTVCWKFTSALGEDIGGGAGAAKPEDNKVPAELPTTGTGVADLIASIGNIDKNSGDLLQAAREAYDKLTAEEQKLVKNYDQLLAAEREYGRLTNPLPFADVKEQHWAKEAIQYVYSKDLMNGSKDGAFEPEAELSRAMLVTILYRLEGAPAAAGHNTFTDVTDRDWFTNAVLWASSNNLVSGYGDGKFGANDAITREQLASILMRYSQYKQYDTNKKANLNGFADKGQISSWAESSVAWAKAEGLLNGRTAANIAPQGEVTRAETAAILMRYLQKFELTKIK